MLVRIRKRTFFLPYVYYGLNTGVVTRFITGVGSKHKLITAQRNIRYIFVFPHFLLFTFYTAVSHTSFDLLLESIRHNPGRNKIIYCFST